MSRDLIEVEIKHGRNRLSLRKVIAGDFLKAVHGAAVSFFYEVKLNGELRVFTNDPETARSIWLGCHRWMLTGASITAEVLP